MSEPSIESQIAQIHHFFAQGNIGEGLLASEKILLQGRLDFPLLEKAFNQAKAINDTDFMARVLSAIKTAAPQLKHWRIGMLQASYHEARHDWLAVLKALRKAEKWGANPASIRLQKAAVRERLLEPNKALVLLENFEGEGRQFDYAQSIRARCYEQLGDTEMAITLLEEWLPCSGKNSASMDGHKLLGRLYDKQQQWSKAWYWVERGNALGAELYNGEVSNSDIRWRVEVWHQLYSQQSRFEMPCYPVKGSSPVFLLGFPRSGTTLLEQILDSHPSIQALEEPPTVMLALRHAVEWAKAKAWVKGLLGKSGQTKKHILTAIFREMGNFSRDEVERLREMYWDSVRSLLGGKPQHTFVDKMPLNTVDIAFINMLFPDAKFVVALRHPADVLLSCHMQSFEANDAMANFHELVSGAIFYRQVMALLQRYEKKLALDDRVHFIRYEDLTTDFDAEARKLMAFISLSYEEEQSNYHLHARARGSLATPSYQGVTKPIYRNAVARWEHYVPWLEPVFEHLAPACKHFGYFLPEIAG